jgi:2'-5' RNA ligase
VFFALWPDAGWCAQLLDAAAPLLRGQAQRALRAADLHVTLCFLGAVDEPRVMRLRERAGAIRAEAFELRFDAFEFWPRSRVLAARCADVPTAANELARALAELALELGLQPDRQALRPHVTLLRGVAPEDLPYSGECPLALHLPFSARHFDLAYSFAPASSIGAAQPACRYDRLASWPLPSRGESAAGC